MVTLLRLIILFRYIRSKPKLICSDGHADVVIWCLPVAGVFNIVCMHEILAALDEVTILYKTKPAFSRDYYIKYFVYMPPGGY